MSAKAMSTAEKQGAALEELRKDAARIQKNIDEANARLAASQQSQSQLATEREKLVLPARVNGDAGAQKRLREIEAQLVDVRQGISYDAAAIAELGAQLTTAEQAVELAEWEERRAKVRCLLMKRADGAEAGKLAETVRALAAGLKALAEEDRLIASELTLFEPGLHSCANEIARLDRLRALVFALELRDVVRVDISGLHVSMLAENGPEERDRRIYQDAVERLDQMELVF
jgi:hypothetical protein